MEEKDSNKVQQFGVAASVRKMEQVPEAVGEDGLNKRMGLHVVTSCSYSNPSLASATSTPLKLSCQVPSVCSVLLLTSQQYLI